MKIIHNFKKGDRVTMLDDCLPHLDKGYIKGDTGVITDTSPICWEVSVRIDKNNHEWGVTDKCISLLKKTPIDMKYLITIKEHEFALYPHEIYGLYCKLKRIKNKFTFQGKRIELNKKDKEYEIIFNYIKEIITRENFYE